jgi:hypothetical protein
MIHPDFTYPNSQSNISGSETRGATYVELFLRHYLSFPEAIHHLAPGHSAACVALGVKEWLTIANVHRGHTLKIVHGEVVVVCFRLQGLEAFKVGFEKYVSFFAVVHATGFWHDGVQRSMKLFQTFDLRAGWYKPERSPIPLSQLPSQVERQSPFDVYMELNFGDCEDKFVVGCQ